MQRKPNRTNILFLVGLWVVLSLIPLAGLPTSSPLSTIQARPSSTVYVVFPHPDDEFQAWSLIEGEPDEYKVFVALTRGEAVGFCNPRNLKNVLREDLGEQPPNPTPEDTYTETCEQARASSLLNFLHQMSQTDPTIPGNFGAGQTFTVGQESEVEPCRTASKTSTGETEGCDHAKEVKVWTDEEGRGAVVIFNLGDGDLTKEEVQWAVEALLSEGEQWGLDTPGEPTLIGGFSNYETDFCPRYDQPDHHAVERALYEVDYGVGPQLGATCFDDPRTVLTATVSEKSVQAAFEVADDGTRLGAHGVHYGWLHEDVYPLARWDQSEVFHRVQSFWVRFAD